MVKFKVQVLTMLCILSFECPKTACDSEAALCYERTQRLEKSIPGEASPASVTTIKTTINTSILSTVSKKTSESFQCLCVSILDCPPHFIYVMTGSIYVHMWNVLFNLTVFTGAWGRGRGTWSARVYFAAFPVAC